MASRTTSKVEKINLEGTVNKEQYHTALQALWEAGRASAQAHDWCTSWIQIFHDGINRDFPYERNQYEELRSEVDVAEPQHEADFDYATELKNTRGRILWYAREGSVRLEEANAGLNAAGLDGFQTGDKVFTVAVRRFNVAAASETAATIQERLAAVLRELNVEGVTVMEMSSYPVEVTEARYGAEIIPASETVPPLHRL